MAWEDKPTEKQEKYIEMICFHIGMLKIPKFKTRLEANKFIDKFSYKSKLNAADITSYRNDYFNSEYWIPFLNGWVNTHTGDWAPSIPHTGDSNAK